MNEESENFKKRKYFFKVPNWNYRAKEWVNWNEKSTEGFDSRLDQAGGNKKISKLRQGSGIHSTRGAKGKKNEKEWRLIKGLMGHHQEKEHMHYRGPG